MTNKWVTLNNENYWKPPLCRFW